MAEIFEMPQASPTMEVGTILSWQKEEGAELAPQDVIAEVETDKAAMEIEVFDKGYLLKILVEAGEEVPAGAPIAIIGTDPDEDISALLEQVAAGKKDKKPAPKADAAGSDGDADAGDADAGDAGDDKQAARPAADSTPAGLPPLTWKGREIDPAIMEAPRVFGAGGSGATPASGGRVRSSPAARRAARERGVDLSQVHGSGPRGRVTSADVESYTPRAGGAAAAPVERGSEQVRNSQMRKTIARRLKQVWQDAPAFYLTARFTCDALVAFRAQLKDAGVKVSYNDILIKAAARALRDVPEVNASWGDTAITRHHDVHIGVAVALDDGLITPVVRHADKKGLAEIADGVRDLAGRARDRKLQPDEYQGSTFTISNLGMMDIEHFTAILNPPEACILAVGGLAQEPVVVDGAVTVAWQMRVTMTCDHRVVDGALGARFLQALRRYVENPALLAA